MEYEPDNIEDAMASWATLIPDLDVVTMRTTLLFGRAGQLGRHHVEQAFAACGLSSGEFDVLASLIHAPDHTSKPSQLARRGILSPAGMTNRLDRLEEAGWIERRPDPSDRRSTLVVLTPTGRDKAMEAARAHVSAEAELFATLDTDERRQLDHLLVRLLEAYDAARLTPTTDP
ncbi:MAG: MarR family transcriptional regulator [Actinomycetota bacterium]